MRTWEGAGWPRTSSTLAAAVRWHEEVREALTMGANPPGPATPGPLPRVPETVAEVASTFGAAINAGAVRTRDGHLDKS